MRDENFVDGRLRERYDLDARIYYSWDANGVALPSRPFTPAENAKADAALAAELADVNRATIETQATAALAANKTFLALPSPTNAQNAAQIKALTRQMNGVIRLLLKRLDAAD